MSERLSDFDESTVIALVTFTEPDNLDQYTRANNLSFPVLVDPDRSAYLAFGLGRGRLTRIWGWKAAKRYAQIIRRHGLGKLRVPVEDTRQLGGDFVLDAEGTLVYGFWGDGPDDRPDVDALVAAARSVP